MPYAAVSDKGPSAGLTSKQGSDGALQLLLRGMPQRECEGLDRHGAHMLRGVVPQAAAALQQGRDGGCQALGQGLDDHGQAGENVLQGLWVTVTPCKTQVHAESQGQLDTPAARVLRTNASCNTQHCDGIT